MKRTLQILMVITSTELLLGQSSAPASPTSAPVSMNVANYTPKPAAVPNYLVYRHFLGMVNDLNNKAIAAGAGDPYAFAQPFLRAGFVSAELDVLLNEAQALASDLAAHDAKVKAAVTNFRQGAQAAFSQGQPMPPLPQEINDLSALRTALIVRHMANLRANLGVAATAKLDAYLAREFTPHVSLKALVRPQPLPIAAQATAPAQ